MNFRTASPVHEIRRWSTHAELSADATAEQLGITAASVATARRRYDTFPAPVSGAASGPTARYRASEIYDFQLSLAKDQRRRPRPVPRLHPRRVFGAATLTTSITLRAIDPQGRSITWIAYLIDPHDDGEHVALTYRLDPSGMIPPLAELEQVRDALAQQGADHAAIILPGNDFYPSGDGSVAPYITVLDGAGAWSAGWTDLVEALPGVQLPWWPQPLRSAAVMRRWRPGDDPVVVVPVDWTSGPVRTAERLRDAPDTHPNAVDALQNLLDRWRFTHTPLAVDRLSRSVASAAVLPPLPDGVPEHPTADMSAALLHQVVTDLDGEDLLALLPSGVTPGAAAHVRIIGGDELAGNALAERWRGRLVDAGPRAGEFGFTVARSAMLSGDELVQLVDPLAPDVWVVEDRATGTITHTVGDRTPAARGALTTAAITAGSRSAIAFYTDAAGVEWPIPAAETDEFCIGYVGDGPRRLVKILKLLSDDAAADTLAARKITAPANRAADEIFAEVDDTPILLRQADCR
ncbi:hypothetical protein [Tsukamurella hominis]|uniref:hypothetical protein n=1 Tax=Tsukamurella hominis TaxID=1970232 RepID=UPI0039EC4D66